LHAINLNVTENNGKLVAASAASAIAAFTMGARNIKSAIASWKKGIFTITKWAEFPIFPLFHLAHSQTANNTPPGAAECSCGMLKAA
jgi:hypothetical protein